MNITNKFSLDIIRLKPKRKRAKQAQPREVWFPKKVNTLKYKILRGDLDISKEQDCRLYYWGIKNNIIDKDCNILEGVDNE